MRLQVFKNSLSLNWGKKEGQMTYKAVLFDLVIN